MKLLVLPGFLGTRADFGPWLEHFHNEWTTRGGSAFTEVKTLAVCENPEWTPQVSWDEWLYDVVEKLESWKGREPVVAIGYSLGGRLLLSMAHQNPWLFSKLVLMSVNPGLKTNGERSERLKSDEAWAKRFESESWTHLMRDWNAQGVFRGSIEEPERIEDGYSRAALSEVLRCFSLGHQNDFREWLQTCKLPQLWIAGERDEKFVGYLKEIRGPAITREIIPDASHRVYLDQPLVTARGCAEFLCSSNLATK